MFEGCKYTTKHLREVVWDWAAWADKTFPHATSVSKLKHASKEISELILAPDDATEYADALMLIIGAARKQGITFDHIITAAVAKLEVNKARKWGKVNADGFVEHIKE